jgi:hypothetical protein
MSDLSIVLPSDWIELADVETHILNNIGVPQLQGMIDDGSWEAITALMEEVWQPPAGTQMVGARLFVESTVRMFVRLE